MDHHATQERKASTITTQRTARSAAEGLNDIPTGGAWGASRAPAAAGAAAVQMKLTVNQPGDSFEQEADHVAEQVIAMPAPGAARTGSSDAGARAAGVPVVQRKCAACEKEHVQAKEVPGASPHVTPGLQRQIESLRGGGSPLPGSERAYMEPRFGSDFSNVRVHTGGAAAETARALNARAYTVGNDVVFGAGQYAPGTIDGRRLLAHELVHTIQQSRGGGVAARAMRKCAACAGHGEEKQMVQRKSGEMIQRAGSEPPRKDNVGVKPIAPDKKEVVPQPGPKPKPAPMPGPNPLPEPKPAPKPGQMKTYRARVAAVSYLSCAPCNPFTDDGQSGVTPPVTEPISQHDFRQSHFIEGVIGTYDGVTIASGSAAALGSGTPGISGYCGKKGTAHNLSSSFQGTPKFITNANGVEGVEFSRSYSTRVGATVPATLPGAPCGYLGTNPLVPAIGNTFRAQFWADGTVSAGFLSATLFPSHNIYVNGTLLTHNGKPVHPRKDFDSWSTSTVPSKKAGEMGFWALRYACCHPYLSQIECPSVCVAGISVPPAGVLSCSTLAGHLAVMGCPEPCGEAGTECSSLSESANP